MQIKFNQSDWRKIEQIIQSADAEARSGNIRLKWILQRLNQYKKVVQEAMGSISARGGYIQMSFMTESDQEYWKNLAPSTLALKAGRAGIYFADHGAKETYDMYADQFVIWKDSGTTQQSVVVDPVTGFAGIDSQPALYRAVRTELGEGKIPQRKLFALANRLLIEALRKAFDPGSYSPSADALREELIKDVFIKHGWGKR
jgi:hypothetical protein